MNNVPSVVRGRNVLVPLHTSDSCGELGAVLADTVARCTVSKNQCGLVVFRRMHGSRLSPQVRTGVAATRRDYNYQLVTTKLGRKKGNKIIC
jgi:hypothetical protein